MTEQLAQLISAASHATERSVRVMYLAEARSRLVAERERLRELFILLEGLENKAAEQLPLAGSK